MSLRLDKWGTELPPPSDPDPAGAAAVQETLYRFSPDDYKELVAVFTGPHPETGDELVVEDGPPPGFEPLDLPPQEEVFAPDYAPDEIAEIAQKLRKEAGLA